VSALVWQHRLEEAATAEAVLHVVNDFLAPWTPEEIAQLPADCRPGVFEDTEQVNLYALKLARRHTIGIGEVSVMHRMATFFTKAALRAFQINEAFLGDMPSRERDGRASS
jgi:hypothetical protein